jgi:hypothetical protein
MVINLVNLRQDPEAPPSALPLVLSIVAYLLWVGGVVGLHALQKENLGLIGHAGFYTVVLAFAALILAQLILLLTIVTQILGTLTLLVGSEALLWFVGWVQDLGSLGLMIGFVLYGLATLGARVVPRWCGVLLIVLFPVSLFLGIYGNIWIGVGLWAVGYVLGSRWGVTAEHRSRLS